MKISLWRDWDIFSGTEIPACCIPTYLGKVSILTTDQQLIYLLHNLGCELPDWEHCLNLPPDCCGTRRFPVLICSIYLGTTPMSWRIVSGLVNKFPVRICSRRFPRTLVFAVRSISILQWKKQPTPSWSEIWRAERWPSTTFPVQRRGRYWKGWSPSIHLWKSLHYNHQRIQIL